jgi:esterase/lipase superfamily enzyme
MPKFFTPSLSYRLTENGGGVQAFGILKPGGLLSQYRSIVFFVHGYNNDQQAASGAYENFLPRLGRVTAQPIGVYWPGDNWAGGLYYTQAVKKVEQVAERFARDIHDAAKGSGALEISFVAHSLGCRVTLETLRVLRDLQRAQPTVSLKLRNVVFMAGAVPTFFLEENRPLHRTVRDLTVSTKSLYSEADRVLHYAFPLGQSAIGQGFFPTALGRTRWQGATVVNPAMQQKENPGAGHSDYWGSGSKNAASLATAAGEVRNFIPLGAPPAPRSLSVRATTTARSTEGPRETPARSV